MNAKLFNINQIIKESGIDNSEFNLIPDSKIIPIVDKLLPELLNKENNRILFGYPRNLNQIHHLRKMNIYPNKIFIINTSLENSRERLGEKLFQKSKNHTKSETSKLDMILQEYKTLKYF